MVALSFAAVPFYSWFCRVTGFAGTTGVAEAPAAEELARLVTVSFDANTAPGMPWEFRPKQRSMTLRLGETGLAFFEAYNPTDETTAGQAGFNVVPFAVGGYFDKIQGASERNAWRVAGMYTLGNSEFHLNYGATDDDDNIGNNSGAKQWTVGYNYNLSKRTKVYGFYTKIDNENLASYGTGIAGANFNSYAVGIRHNF